ncbi:MAG: hypothetical protein KAJ35_05320, partial [Thermoplasmata archaeon]|nr:hypothetical protein [Thermoplasmata archaeon]
MDITILISFLFLALALIINPTIPAEESRASVSFKDATVDNATTGDPFNFTVNVTGDGGIIQVNNVFWYGNDSLNQKNRSMTGSGLSPEGYGTYTYAGVLIPSDSVEPLNYSFKAKDGDGIWHTSQLRAVPVLDNDGPVIEQDLSDAEAYTGDPFHFEIIATDNVGIDYVIVMYGIGDHWEMEQMVPVESNRWEYDGLVIPLDSIEDFWYRFQVQDAAGRWDAFERNYVEMIDNDPPFDIRDLTDGWNITKGLSHTFSMEVMDNIGIMSVHMEYWFGLGSRSSVNMTPGDGTFSIDIDVPRHPSGDLYYLYRVVDAGTNQVESDVYQANPINQPPEISSIPPWQLTEKEEARLDLSPYINDPNDPLESLEFTCIEPPMVVAEGHFLVANYTLWWPPHDITFCVFDGEDRVNGTVQATVKKVPVIISTPLKTGKVNVTYDYQLEWEVDETFPGTPQITLAVRPGGMTVGSNGLVTWTPSSDQHDVHDVQVILTHGGMTTSQYWSIDVVIVQPPPDNKPPAFIDYPLRNAIPGELFEWTVEATDPDEDKLYF